MRWRVTACRKVPELNTMHRAGVVEAAKSNDRAAARKRIKQMSEERKKKPFQKQ